MSVTRSRGSPRGREFTGTAPRSAIELAAGPADHAVEFARRGVRALALDLSPTMCRRAQEGAAAAGVSVELLCGAARPKP